MPLPDFNSEGDLPPGIHEAPLADIIARLSAGGAERQTVTANLLRIHHLVQATGRLERFVIFGSFVTAKLNPKDVDIFLVMAEDFEVDDYTGETRAVFSHGEAQRLFGASVFWATRQTSQTLLEDLLMAWQTKRDQTQRGIVEVIR
jgi:hypothetical protein